MQKRQKGKVGWMPSVLCTEIQVLKLKNKLNTDAEAITKLVKYAQVGRATESVIKFVHLGCRPQGGGRRRKNDDVDKLFEKVIKQFPKLQDKIVTRSDKRRMGK